MNDRKGDWIQTVSGRPYWPLDPRPDDVRLTDIAHHLGNICRFTGACREFYSVAEHAVHVSYVVPPALALHGLHHDDPEYVCNDLARPVKYEVVGYREVERLNEVAINQALGLRELSDDEHRAIKHADNAMLLAESEALMAPRWLPRAPIEVPADYLRRAKQRLAGYPRLYPVPARELYLARHHELTR